MLTVHHLGHSQSERIVWLCEALDLEYELKHYTRDAVTILAPPDLRALTPMGTAPVITDADVTLGESGAVMAYILGRYGEGRLQVAADQPAFPQYLFWLNFANSTLQAIIGRNMILARLSVALPPDNPMLLSTRARLDRALRAVDDRLGAVPYFAGAALTAADIMTVFSLTTMRIFMPYELGPYPNILAYLQRIGGLGSYRRAMKKGDPDLVPMLT